MLLSLSTSKLILHTNFEDDFYDEAIPYSIFLASCLLQVLNDDVIPIFMPYTIHTLSEAVDDPENNPFVFPSLGAAFVTDLQNTAFFLKTGEN